jgi:hypothetical protein
MRLRAIRRTLPRPSPATFGYRNTGPVLPPDATRGFLPPLRTANRSLQTSARRARDGSSEKALCLSKYIAAYVWTYAGLYRALRRHMCLHSYGDLCLNLNLDLDLNLNLFLFLNSFQELFLKSFALSFGKLFNLRYRKL